MINLSKKQLDAFDGIMDFVFNQEKQIYVFSGVAGSGKTSIISILTEQLDKVGFNYRVLALTGRAVSVIKTYCKNKHNTSTIHSFIYVPMYNDDGDIIGYQKRYKNELSHLDCLIVDEASMIDEVLLYDLISFEIPILFVGDSEQLPPINSNLNIMEHPDFHLNEIHRVAEGSPIISLSRDIRENGALTKQMLNRHIDNEHLIHLPQNSFNKDYVIETNHDIVLCGTNRKRTMINNLYRSTLTNWDFTPQQNEPIMCLRNGFNEKTNQYMYNGEIYIVQEVLGKEQYKILLDDKQFVLKIKDCSWDGSCDIDSKTGYSDNLFTYSYATTVHKSQGSQFNDVCYFRENVSSFCDQRRFDYTAVTRAKERLTIAL